MTSPSNSVFHALDQIINTFLGKEYIACHDEISSNASVRILSYQNDFEYLWGIAQSDDNRILNFLDNVDQLSHIIIVWDDIPSSKANSMVNLSNYLTPLDWAIWYTLRLHDNSKQPSKAQGPIISIFDTASDRFTKANSVRLINQFQNQSPSCMPGIQVYRPTPCITNKHTIIDLIATIFSNIPFKDNNSHVISDYDMVRKLWRSSFLTPTIYSDHHAIANVIGPLLLLDDPIDDPLVMALKKLLIQLDLLPDSSSSEQLLKQQGPGWIDWESDDWSEKIAHLKIVGKSPINLLLVDDAAIRHRWGEVIARALNLNTYNCPTEKIITPRLAGQGRFKGIDAYLYITESANGFVQSLNIPIDNINDTDRSNKFVLGCSCKDQEGQLSHNIIDLLFLDLRLFQGNNLTEEVQFFEEIVGFAKSFCENINGDKSIPSWPCFDAREIESIEKWIVRVKKGDNANSNDIEYIQALTLLPRLISNLDFSLPIILFSSTGKRQIIETLRPYSNIITDFEKPRLQLGQDTYLADVLAIKFKLALSKALDLITARRFCNTLITSTLEPPWNKYKQILPLKSEEGTWRIHLMLDEAQKPTSPILTIGGLLAIYPPNEEPNRLSNTIFSHFPGMKNTKEYTRQNAEIISKEVINECNQRNILIIPIYLTGNYQKAVHCDLERDNDFVDEHVGDNLHRQLLRCIAELGIYCIARQILPREVKAEFSVMAPARIQYINPKSELALQEHWGYTATYLGKYKQIISDLNFLLTRNHGENTLYGENIKNAAWALCNEFVRAEKNEKDDRYDIQEKKSELKQRIIQYFDRHDARPLIEEIMIAYRNSYFEPSPGIIRAYSLNAFGTNEIDRIHALHFLTDKIAGLKQNDLCEGFKERSIYGQYNKKLVTFLESHRLIVKKLIPQGLAHIGKDLIPNDTSDLAFTFLYEAHKNAAKELTVQEFIQLSQLLIINLNSPDTTPIIHIRGYVIGKDINKITIKVGKDIYSGYVGDCTGFQNINLGDEVSFDGRRGRTPKQRRASKVRKCNH